MPSETDVLKELIKRSKDLLEKTDKALREAAKEVSRPSQDESDKSNQSQEPPHGGFPA